jgi:predicted chitinase
MANSEIPGPLGRHQFPDDAPGPLGLHERRTPRDTPGPLGINDWAEFIASAYSWTPGPLSSHGCACGRGLTIDELCEIFAKQKRKVCQQYLAPVNSTVKRYSITTCLRKAHFLAQIGHESGELRYSAEVLKKGTNESAVYDGYKGRGLIQITYARNYMAYGKSVHHNFQGLHRRDLEQPAWATDSAGWYWTAGSGPDLNRLADKNDLLAITARVNGGFNGLEDRKVHLQSAMLTLQVHGCKASGCGDQHFRPFKDSDIYNNRIHSFAWGCWNDPASGKSGVVKSAEDLRAGYRRFLELSKESGQRNRAEHTHFGFSPEKMHELATEGLK